MGTHTDRGCEVGVPGLAALDAFQLGRRGRRVPPGLVEELELAALEAVAEPAICGLIEDGEAVEERYAVFRKDIGVLGDERMVKASSGEEGEEKESERGPHSWGRRLGGLVCVWAHAYGIRRCGALHVLNISEIHRRGDSESAFCRIWQEEHMAADERLIEKRLMACSGG